MIRRQTEQYNWEFIYLGAGPNVEREKEIMEFIAHGSCGYML